MTEKQLKVVNGRCAYCGRPALGQTTPFQRKRRRPASLAAGSGSAKPTESVARQPLYPVQKRVLSTVAKYSFFTRFFTRFQSVFFELSFHFKNLKKNHSIQIPRNASKKCVTAMRCGTRYHQQRRHNNKKIKKKRKAAC